MKNRVLAGLAVLGAAAPMAATQPAAPIVGAQHAAPLHFAAPDTPAAPAAVAAETTQARAMTPRDSALHALNRLAYGPRPGELDRVAAQGVMNWINRQLSADEIDDRLLARRERWRWGWRWAGRSFKGNDGHGR